MLALQNMLFQHENLCLERFIFWWLTFDLFDMKRFRSVTVPKNLIVFIVNCLSWKDKCCRKKMSIFNKIQHFSNHFFKNLNWENKVKIKWFTLKKFLQKVGVESCFFSFRLQVIKFSKWNQFDQKWWLCNQINLILNSFSRPSVSMLETFPLNYSWSFIGDAQLH